MLKPAPMAPVPGGIKEFVETFREDSVAAAYPSDAEASTRRFERVCRVLPGRDRLRRLSSGPHMNVVMQCIHAVRMPTTACVALVSLRDNCVMCRRVQVHSGQVHIGVDGADIHHGAFCFSTTDNFRQSWQPGLALSKLTQPPKSA